jgi:two-component system cell cycle sensor histidine kinase/response regulator CckA
MESPWNRHGIATNGTRSAPNTDAVSEYSPRAVLLEWLKHVCPYGPFIMIAPTDTTAFDSESRLKVLVDHNPDLITIIDREYRLRFINHTDPDPTIRKEDLLGINVIELTPPEYRPWLLDQYDIVWTTGKQIDIEVPILWRGEKRWFSSRLMALPNGEDPPIEILVVARESTRHILLERALRESETGFRQFAEALEDVIWILDTNPERVVFVNASFERIWGLPRQRLYDDSRAWAKSVHPDDRSRVTALFNAVLEGVTDNVDVEYRILRPDGGERRIHDYGVAIRDEHGRPVRLTGIARDITARRQAEEEKLVLERQLLEAQKLESLGVLAGGIAHDFNNLLTGILGTVNLAQLEPLAAPLRTKLEQIESIALRASDLCKQMLAYAGKGRFIVAPLDVNTLINEISHLVNISISKKVALHLHQTERLPAIRGDASQLRQVLLNLVINAAEALGERVGVVRIATGQTELAAEELTSFKVGAELKPGPYVFVEVSDNGPGMAAEVAERIFEPFFTTKFTGRGLGLSAVQGIMRSHGGAVRVVSRLGNGTAFTLLLPPDVSVAPAPSTSTPPLSAFSGHGEVLIVDDEEIIRSTLATMLESFGFTVVTADNGREAIRIFERRHAQLKFVLIDLTMPVLSGEESHAEFVRIDPDVPIIFMSGYMEQELTDRAVHPSAGFLQKPFRMEELEALIAKVVNRGPV